MKNVLDFYETYVLDSTYLIAEGTLKIHSVIANLNFRFLGTASAVANSLINRATAISFA